MRRLTPWPLVVMLLTLGAAPATASPIRGITISTHFAGQEWADDSIIPTVERIADTGANWVAIHPYAWIQNDGTVRFEPINDNNVPRWITRPIEAAHQQGLQILIKPHLGYWGSSFSWRGEIRFEDDARWDRFFETYTAWVTDLASATREADAFCVGTELDATVSHVTQWRKCIAAVRSNTDLPLTYAANWADYEGVEFWDALDVIGIQAYFPISESSDPTDEELRAGWKSIRGRLRSYSEEFERPIVFSELGYNQNWSAASEPWVYRVDGLESAELQARCLRIALEQVEHEPSILGVFLWKWFPEPHAVGRNFQLAVPTMLEAIESVWGSGE